MSRARAIPAAALSLGALAAAAAGLIALTRALTHERIAAEQRRLELAALAAVLPEDFDNDPLADRIHVEAPAALGRSGPVPVLRARRGGRVTGYVIAATAPDGYAGPIELLIGVDPAGRVLGVRVTGHSETPGLGDPIDARRSDWIEAFRGRALGDPPAARWTVRRDGGDFDQFAGATISPRAVVVAVRKALAWFADHRDTLEQTPPS